MTELMCGAILRLIPIKDDTEQRLLVNREEKRAAMRRRYTGMTPSMMWRAPEEDPKNEEGKKADKKKVVEA